MTGIEEDTQALFSSEVDRLRRELAQERARGEAERIAYEAQLADARALASGGGAPTPLLYAWSTAERQTVRIRVGDKDVAIALGCGREAHPMLVWAAIQRIVSEGLSQ